MYLEDGGYTGWWGLDYFPYREDISKAAEISIANVLGLREWSKQIDRTRLRELQQSGDATETQRYLHELFLAPAPVLAGQVGYQSAAIVRGGLMATNDHKEAAAK